MKNIEINVLQDFVSEHPGVLFAMTPLKKLTIGVGNSNYMVYKRSDQTSEWELVYSNVQPYPALEFYNNLP